MKSSVEHIHFLGRQAVKVRTTSLEGTIVPGWGSNLLCLRWLPLGINILRTPPTAEDYLESPGLYGAPILFPPNRIDGGAFTFNGREYRFPINETDRENHIHGLVMRAAWTLTKAEAEGSQAIVETSISSADHPGIIAALPHRFTIRHRFLFAEDSVTMTCILHNEDEAPIPWGLGYHTTFPLPLAPHGDSSRCTFQLHADRQWVLNERLLPTGELIDNPYREEMAKGMDLTGIELDDAYAAATGKPMEAVLTDRDAGLRVTYRADNAFKHWVLFNGKGFSVKGLLCPEPYTWITNAPNLDLPAEATGFRALPPGETVQVVTAISVTPDK